MVYANQQAYYDAITASTNAGQSGPNDKRLLLLIDGNPTITASDAAERMGVSLRGAEKIFKRLRDVGVISRQGSRKSGSWAINK